MRAIPGALGGQSISLIVSCYKHPLLKQRNIINGVAFLKLSCSIRINGLIDGIIVCSRHTYKEGYLDAVLYDYSSNFIVKPA
jgi:hypothetical protein